MKTNLHTQREEALFRHFRIEFSFVIFVRFFPLSIISSKEEIQRCESLFKVFKKSVVSVRARSEGFFSPWKMDWNTFLGETLDGYVLVSLRRGGATLTLRRLNTEAQWLSNGQSGWVISGS